MTTRYGVIYKAGGYTGGISDHQHAAAAYARVHKAAVYVVGSKDDPEVKPKHEEKQA
jgi:hypothetical protein